MWFTFQAEIAQTEENIEFVGSSYLPSISDSLYKLDESQLRLLLRGVLQLQGIDYCEVFYSIGGERLNIVEGNPESPKKIVRELPIRYQNRKGELKDIGVLVIRAGYRGFWLHVLDLRLLGIVFDSLQIFLTAY